MRRAGLGLAIPLALPMGAAEPEAKYEGGRPTTPAAAPGRLEIRGERHLYAIGS